MRLVVSKFSTSSVSLRKFPEAEDKRDSKLSSNVFRVILKSFCCFVRSNFKQKKKNLKDRTNQYCLHQLSGHMEGVFWDGLTSFCLVANIKLFQSHLTLGVMRPSIWIRWEGALMGNYTHIFSEWAFTRCRVYNYVPMQASCSAIMGLLPPQMH